MKLKDTILIYSGGMDSSVLLYYLISNGINVKCLTIDYGQKHKKEITSAINICKNISIEHKIVDLSSLSTIFSTSSLVNANINLPLGHYEKTSMKSAVVPNRNMILLSIATAWAIDSNIESVSYAAHSGDHAIYPDCREIFANAMNTAIGLCDWKKVFLNRPFVSMKKTDICKLGNKLKIPFEKTWSCYEGKELHCGKCGTCIERREAFYLSGVSDLTKYEKNAPSIEQMLESNWKLNDE